MKIGLAIAMRREQLGITQDELAKAVGVSKASISRWESGDISNMRRDRIQKLAEALKVSPLSLLEEETDGLHELDYFNFALQEQENENSAPDNKVRSAIIGKINQLSDSQLDRLLGYLEGLLSE